MGSTAMMFKALADENRLLLLRLLLRRNCCVRALARQLDISEAAVSQHLKVLREAGLIFGEKCGYFMHGKRRVFAKCFVKSLAPRTVYAFFRNRTKSGLQAQQTGSHFG